MNKALVVLICIGIGYFIGTINPSFFIAKLKGFDIRQKGSRNAGASNALILFGKVTGVLCALFDIFKSCLAIELASKIIFPEFDLAFAITGTAAVLGHMFPFYMKFKGGKGTATLGGMILVMDWRIFLILLALEIVLVLVTDYLCFMPITACVIFPILYGIYSGIWSGAAIILLTTAAILYKNIDNIKKILNKTEMHLSYLWNKNKELERIEENESKAERK